MCGVVVNWNFTHASTPLYGIPRDFIAALFPSKGSGRLMSKAIWWRDVCSTLPPNVWLHIHSINRMVIQNVNGTQWSNWGTNILMTDTSIFLGDSPSPIHEYWNLLPVACFRIKKIFLIGDKMCFSVSALPWEGIHFGMPFNEFGSVFRSILWSNLLIPCPIVFVQSEFPGVVPLVID